MGLFGSGWKKKRDRYAQEYIGYYTQINEEYELGLEWNEMWLIAYDYATKRAKSERGFFDKLFGALTGDLDDLVDILGFIIVTVVAVVATIYTYGGSSPYVWSAWASYIASAASVVISAYAIEINARLERLSLDANTLQDAMNMSRLWRQTKEQGDQLTHFILYGGYEIYANGSIYKKNAAGSESVSPSQAFDTSKGLRGDVKTIDIDEKISSRVGANQGGGEKYMQKTLDTYTPLKAFNHSIEARLDYYQNRLKIRTNQINEGFTKLFELNFNSLGTGKAIYERQLEKLTLHIKKAMISSDFLDKMKNYNRDLRADFWYLRLKDFKQKTKKEVQSDEEIKEEIITSNKNKSVEFKARKYLEMLIFIVDSFCYSINERAFCLKKTSGILAFEIDLKSEVDFYEKGLCSSLERIKKEGFDMGDFFKSISDEALENGARGDFIIEDYERLLSLSESALKYSFATQKHELNPCFAMFDERLKDENEGIYPFVIMLLNDEDTAFLQKGQIELDEALKGFDFSKITL